ncbi:MAG: hypothetical protein C5B59_10700 [Bacteroidetes bacterium]|nr:MAG: hypothetical protein C5B59_10700 [Bacteroidota bacterium]
MRTEDIQMIYDSKYASEYNERFLFNPYCKVSADAELKLLKGLINSSTRWLDVACGTGYFLSQFPGIQRAGMDLSPEMIKISAAENPDALFFEQGDFRDEHPEWNDAWTLVSCMWTPYVYLNTVKEVEILIQNLANWTKTGGALFLPIVDIEDLREFVTIPYDTSADMFGGNIQVTSVTWTWQESNGKYHEHLVAPHIEHIIKILQPYFDKLEVIRYPPYNTGWVSRKSILATGKLTRKNEMQPGEVTWHKIPEATNKLAQDSPYLAFRKSMFPLSNKALISELFFRLRSGHLFKALAQKAYRSTFNRANRNGTAA